MPGGNREECRTMGSTETGGDHGERGVRTGNTRTKRTYPFVGSVDGNTAYAGGTKKREAGRSAGDQNRRATAVCSSARFISLTVMICQVKSSTATARAPVRTISLGYAMITVPRTTNTNRIT